MDFPVDSFLRPVPGDADLFAFQVPFEIEGKALGNGEHGPTVEELEDGDLIIHGWAAEYDGTDRQNENFTDGAFQRGVKSFLEGSASLCFHHKHDKCLGKVLSLKEVEGKGLEMTARVDGAIRTHPELGTIYQQIKRGTLTALSVGGFFKRALTPNGWRINDVDLTEISVTPVAVHTKPSFAVVAGKALENIPAVETETVTDFTSLEAGLAALRGNLDQLESQLRPPEGKSVKGDPDDLYVLALLLRLEQVSNGIRSAKPQLGEPAETDSDVDALIKRVTNYLDGIAREVHGLAAKYGPLPNIPAYSGPYDD